MDGTVVFSKDGVLRFKHCADGSPSVPLILICDALGEDPQRMFIQQLRKPVLLESGSTVGTFLLCLSPFAQTVTDLCDRDVQSYIDEIRKPSAESLAFDRCEIRRKVHFGRKMYHEPMPDDVDFIEWINRDRGEPVWLDTYSISTDFDICGYTDGDVSNYSMSTSIHKLKNVPLVINRTAALLANKREATGTPLFNETAAGVSEHRWGTDDRPNAATVLVAKGESDEDITVYEFIKTVIEVGLWFNTPQGAIREHEMLAEMVKHLPDVTHLDEDEPEDADENSEGEETSGMTVSIAPGAFSGISSHYEREQEEWKELMSKISQIPSMPIRIGAIVEDVPTDDRAMGIIFN